MPVRIELPVPFPLGTVNAWLFPGREPAIVDCGIGDAAVHARLLEEMRRHDVSPAQLRVLLTHGHVDHAGNARRLHDAGARLVCPRQEAPFVETFRRDEERRNDAFAQALRDHGMPQDEVRRVRARSDDIDVHLDDCPIDSDLQDGTDLVLGDEAATAIRTPGHTPGSTCYALDDLLLTGDTLLERITSNAVELKDDDRGAFHRYVETVEGMRRFVGMQALPGHHDPFRITDAVIDGHLERHAQRRQRILSMLDRPRTAWQVYQRLFPGLGPDGHFMGMAEVVGHLHSLEIDGMARMEKRDGVRCFHR